MSAYAATLIFLISAAVALIMAAPLIFWMRYRARLQGPEHVGRYGRALTLIQIASGLTVVVLLSTAFAAEYVAPQSWLGQRVSARDGKFWLLLLVVIPAVAIETAVLERARSRAERAGRSPSE